MEDIFEGTARLEDGSTLTASGTIMEMARWADGVRRDHDVIVDIMVRKETNTDG